MMSKAMIHTNNHMIAQLLQKVTHLQESFLLHHWILTKADGQ